MREEIADRSCYGNHNLLKKQKRAVSGAAPNPDLDNLLTFQ